MEITVIDSSLVVLTIALVEVLKKYVPERYVPLVPLVVSFFLTASWFLANGKPISLSIVFETLKIAFTAMGVFKIGKTTVLGK